MKRENRGSASSRDDTRARLVFLDHSGVVGHQTFPVDARLLLGDDDLIGRIPWSHQTLGVVRSRLATILDLVRLIVAGGNKELVGVRDFFGGEILLETRL